MEDRYSYDKEGPARCRICGGLVHEKTSFEHRLGKSRALPNPERVCQNAECPSKTGDARLAQAV